MGNLAAHPLFVLAVAEMVREAGGKPLVGDSPGVERGERVAEKIGLTLLLARIDVPLVSFSEAVVVDHPEGKVFKHFKVARAVTEVDRIINLAKIKIHAMMILTCAVKNLFGCVPGMRKLRWHFDAGRDRDCFAEMLVDLAYRIRPALTLVDGIVVMEGGGAGQRDALSTRPVVHPENGTLCQVCITHCPAKRMSVKRKQIAIDYAACIRCLCCHEFCPTGAIRVGKGWLAAMARPRQDCFACPFIGEQLCRGLRWRC